MARRRRRRSPLDKAVRALGYRSYAAYLGSPHWKAKRAEVLAAAEGRCRRCGFSAKVLDIDHLTYERLGQERADDLQALCRDCHRVKHGRRPRGARITYREPEPIAPRDAAAEERRATI